MQSRKYLTKFRFVGTLKSYCNSELRFTCSQSIPGILVLGNFDYLLDVLRVTTWYHYELDNGRYTSLYY